uniref:Uncharacterized protein n=1 Tax=Anguilla anguilla TaxID=7936 RepID=A0A0E9Q7T5_ANGAN
MISFIANKNKPLYLKTTSTVFLHSLLKVFWKYFPQRSSHCYAPFGD